MGYRGKECRKMVVSSKMSGLWLVGQCNSSAVFHTTRHRYTG